MALTPGTRLGAYHITAQIGVGGMGEVWSATDTNLGRQVAIKILPDAFAQDPERLARFEREAKTLASLNHPNIATIHGLEHADGIRALVMELVDGPTLADRIAQGPISLSEALSIAKQIADALEAAHDKSVVHRDLKPANVKVRPDGTVKVLDFGLAKALDPVESSTPILSLSPTITTPAATRQGVILGTAAYMSPEQAAGTPVDQRSDIWAFGCVLYEMLTGKPPFPGDSVARVLAKILEREPDFGALPATTPPRISRLIRRCLEKDPRRRLHHIADARMEIEDSHIDEGMRVTASPTVSQRSARWSALLWATGALALGVLGTWLTFSWMQPADDAAPIRSTLATLAATEGSASSFQGLAISPDGRQVVYGWADRLHLRSLEQFESQPLPGTEGGQWPAFSPDGRSVAYFVASESAIKRISLSGGRASTVAATDGGTPQGLSWGSDDTIVFATAKSTGLWRVRAAGGEPERLTRVVPGEALGHYWPFVLPNGRAVLIEVFRGGSSRVGVVSLEDGKVTDLVPVGLRPRYTSTGHLAYLERNALGRNTLRAAAFDPEGLALTNDDRIPVVEDVEWFDVAKDGSLAYLLATAPPPGRLAWVDRKGREEPIDLPIASGSSSVRVSPDGRRIVASIADRGGQELWVSAVERPAWTRIATPDHDGGDWFPMWTSDSTRLVFAIFEVGAGARAPGLFSTTADGTGKVEPLLIINDNSFIDPRSWAPDGRSLLFTFGPFAEPRIGWLPIGDKGAGPWRSLIERAGGALAGPFSPGGDWIVTESTEAEQSSVYIERFPELRDRQQISAAGGGRNAVWSPDGREVFYRRLSDGAMMSVRIQTTPTLSFATPQKLFDAPNSRITNSRGWDVARDGRFLLILGTAVTGSRELVLVQNWTEELKRRVPRN